VAKGGWWRVINGELFFSVETDGVEFLRVLRPVTFLMDGSTTRSGGRCSRLAATGSWLSGDKQRRAAKSRMGVDVIAKAEGESEHEEERVEEDFSNATTRKGIRSCPRGTAAIDGVRSPSRHHARASDQRKPLSGMCN
jgi:hypothetical protein